MSPDAPRATQKVSKKFAKSGRVAAEAGVDYSFAQRLDEPAPVDFQAEGVATAPRLGFDPVHRSGPCEHSLANGSNLTL
jgi:hypothetical protein